MRRRFPFAPGPRFAAVLKQLVAKSAFAVVAAAAVVVVVVVVVLLHDLKRPTVHRPWHCHPLQVQRSVPSLRLVQH